MYGVLTNKYSLKEHMLGPTSRGAMKYLSRVWKTGTQGVEWVCDPKHARAPLNQDGMEGC